MQVTNTRNRLLRQYIIALILNISKNEQTTNIMQANNEGLIACIEGIAQEASKGCGLSHDVYVQKFSGMIDAKFGNAEPELRAAAISIAVKYDYATKAEIASLMEELAEDGCCSHGLTADTCPCGCFENDF